MSSIVNSLDQAQKICRNLLDLDLPETSEKIKDAIKKVRLILPSLTDEDETLLLARLIDVTRVSQEAPRILDKGKIEPWILDKWSNNSEHRRFWKRYRDYLTDEKKIAPKVVARLDELTDNIMDRLADPATHDQFDKRGLVVGNVQSGKTSNYIGLITKAADAGYKFIVVLAGIHSTLRSQTQLRIDEGFLGYDTVTGRSFSQSSNKIGVGKFDPNVPAHSLTSSAINGDFKKNLTDINIHLKGSDPVIVVIKKNNSVLKNLINWLANKEGEITDGDIRVISDLPLLMIDDEADNASINISKSSVSSINGSIRALLELFRKSAYVGYTATPYANVFIPPFNEPDSEIVKGIRVVVGNQNYPVGEDLFPRDFIINIPPPSNYIGPEKFFGIVSEDIKYENAGNASDDNENQTSEPYHLYESVYDNQPIDYFNNNVVSESLRLQNSRFIPDMHKKEDAMPENLPESLKKAVQFFILACAARRVRGQINVHNSMLVHVTRFINWQNHIALLVDDELNKYKRKIEFQDSAFLNDLKLIWEREFEPKSSLIIKLSESASAEMIPVSWNEIEMQLLPAVIKIRVRAVHGSTLLGGLEPENIQAIDYYENRRKGLSVIAIGGNKLSRGLTLEGLTISYYLRASKMYDTLMQMGRWFGYRPGYLDLCRLFTTNDLVSHYKHITAATEEMRAEFDRMALLHEIPENYGLKVRAHTGVLTITAANKFRYKKIMSFSFSGDLKETWQFDKTRKDFFENNQRITENLIQQLGEPVGPLNDSPHLKNQSFVWYAENNHRDVVNYLNQYRASQKSFHIGLIIEYIERQAKKKKLINWTIALINNSKADDHSIIPYSNKVKVGMSYRSDSSEIGSDTYELIKAHIIGNYHEYIDLNSLQLEQAYRETSDDRKEVGKDPEVVHPSPLRIRRNRSETNALLLIYPLNPLQKSRNENLSNFPIVGLALSFPYIKDEEKVPYAVNEVFEKEIYDYPDDLDIEDLFEEEDSENKIIERNNLSEDTFLNLIETTGSKQMNIDESEFSSGLVPSYQESEDLIDGLNKNNIVVERYSVSDKTVPWTPFYTEKEIQRYHSTKEPKNKVLFPENDQINVGSYIVGLKRSRYVIFSYFEKEAAFSDSCWIISSGRINPKYLVCVLNSTLFGAWVRVKGEQKKDLYFIKNEVIYSFPILIPDEELIYLYENILDLLIAVEENEKYTSSSGQMKAYIIDVIDAMIFSVYFSESMKRESQVLISELKKMMPDKISEQKDHFKMAEKLFTRFYDKNSPVREVLFYLNNQSKISRIRSVFTQ